MRIIIVFIVFAISISVNAQNILPASVNNHQQLNPAVTADYLHDSIPAKKWFVTKYAAISTSYIFSKYGNAAVMAAPVGIQLNRRLTNNWYAFAGLSATPAYINFNQAFASAGTKFPQNTGFMKSNNFNLFPRAEMGLMYMNDQKTFSISGSISVERSNSPFGAFNQYGSIRPASYFIPNR